ncbi:hypothetical protein [Dongia mobilis]
MGDALRPGRGLSLEGRLPVGGRDTQPVDDEEAAGRKGAKR